MEFFAFVMPDHEMLLSWIDRYGSIALFILLALGIIALPVPEETLLVFTGIFLSQGELNFVPTLLAAYLGSMTGITCSYAIGRTVGEFIIHRFGRWIGLKEAKIQVVHNWFERYGKWTLVVGYFIPGVRHFTGIVAGSLDIQYSHFALFAYTGATLWVSTFLSLGYFFGHYWWDQIAEIYENLEFGFESLIIAIITLALAIILFRFLRKYHR